MSLLFRGKIKWDSIFPIALLLRIKHQLFAREIYVLGDSHCDVFNHLNRTAAANVKFKVKVVHGATALGLVNPNSATDALNEFRGFLEGVSKNKNVVFLLGEVDTGFVIWYRNEKHSVPIEEETERSLNNYVSFIKECQSKGFKKLTVISVPLPTIADNQDWGEVANKRREISATQKERTAHTIKYNARLGEKVTGLGVNFVSLDHALYNEETQLIRDEYLNRDILDHHLNPHQFGTLILNALREKGII